MERLAAIVRLKDDPTREVADTYAKDNVYYEAREDERNSQLPRQWIFEVQRKSERIY